MKFREGGDTIVVMYSNATIRVTEAGSIDMLVVGGGGGGGTQGGGGGGGGGVVYTQNFEVVAGTYEINVGMGGGGGWSNKVASANGGDSSAFGVVAYGGGAGGSYAGPAGPGSSHPGRNGASGGGGGTGYFGSTSSSVLRWVPGGNGIPGQGHNGGFETNNTNRGYVCGGGGGGAGAPGQDGWVGTVTYSASGKTASPRYRGGCGGDGVMCPIWGDRWYGGGGGGGAGSSAIFEEGRVLRGGRGGGGAGGWGLKNSSSTMACAGEPGFPGTGGGGGGSACMNADYAKDSLNGGDGGSGVVILRYRTPDAGVPLLPETEGTGGTQTRRRGWVKHVFTEDGTLTLPYPTTADVLLVGGGGGGGGFHGGGGGGGGVVVCSNLLLAAGTYDVTIGEGGLPTANTGAPAGRARSTNGGSTTLALVDGSFKLQAFGGGGGGCRFHGQDGATGGGGASMNVYQTSASAPESGPNTWRLGGYGLGGQGYDGGLGTNTTSHFFQFGGGGGGAGGPGSNAWFVAETNYGLGAGGIGVMCDFSGEPTYYGGGGGGGASGRPQGRGGAGGLGGGGTGGGGDTQWISPDHSVTNKCSPGADGVDGLGGGGGGGGSNVESAAIGGKGGSGVLILRYRLRPNGIIFVFR